MATTSTTKRRRGKTGPSPARSRARPRLSVLPEACRLSARPIAPKNRSGSTLRFPAFGDRNARLAIVGLAPGLQGANRTGRPFTGDYAGDLLYATLIEYGFAKGVYQARPDDGMTLVDCRIINGVRCVPPQNKPLPAEIANCRPFLLAAIESMPRLSAHRGARPHRPRNNRQGIGPSRRRPRLFTRRRPRGRPVPAL